ncbi:glutamate ABC transporter substrate-binding protein [Microtetraspora malaysiensis]|uniref:glutamate ABC transporter substrate-binding protein n=1 Tax=Microtetraspora malaysiensis TaxID=161358 RepID=UPI003D9201E8
MRPLLAVLIGTVFLTTVSACASSAPDSIVGKKTLVIGVKPDQPQLGVKLGEGKYEGFEVSVADYIARKLGATDIRYTDAPSSKRESLIRSGQVDLVVATYSITQERKTKVSFAGPYLIAHQDILVREADNSIMNVRDLTGRKICKVTGSDSWRRVLKERQIKAQTVDADNYSECMHLLQEGKIDAVSSDDVILAGLVWEARTDGFPVKLVGAPFTDERFGVGLRIDDIEGCEAVNRIITEMYQGGTYMSLYANWLLNDYLTPNHHVPQFEGCG